MTCANSETGWSPSPQSWPRSAPEARAGWQGCPCCCPRALLCLLFLSSSPAERGGGGRCMRWGREVMGWREEEERREWGGRGGETNDQTRLDMHACMQATCAGFPGLSFWDKK